MKRFLMTATAAVALLGATAASRAQSSALQLRDQAFLTCTDVNAMPAEQRNALGLRFANAASAYYRSQVPDSEVAGQELGWLVRSACTIAPEAYFSTVVARAVRVMGGGIEPPLQQPLAMDQAMFLTCFGAKSLPADQLKGVGSFIGTEAAAYYGVTPGPEWTPDYVAALVHNGCKMYPDAYYLSMIGRAVRAVSPAGATPLAATPPGKVQR